MVTAGKAVSGGLWVVMLAGMVAAAQQGNSAPADRSWTLGPWTRGASEPVIRPDPTQMYADPVSGKSVHWEALHTFNPAAVVRGGKIYVLYRAEDDTGKMAIAEHVSRVGMAVSGDGIHFRQEPQPVFGPANDDQLEREGEGGTEDPRVVEAPDGSYVLTYTQWSRKRQSWSVGLATSPDLRHWTKHGHIFAGVSGGAYDGTYRYKSAGILTERKRGRLIAAKLHGKFWMYWGEVEVHLATSPDLIHWTPLETTPGKPLVLLARRPGLPDAEFPEMGPPPVLTRRGIVVIYNAKNTEFPDRPGAPRPDPDLAPGTYSVEEALFDAADPAKLLARTVQPVFQPELPFERSGQWKPGTTFSEGLVLFKGKWWMYYGCADSFVGVAWAPGAAGR